MATVTAVAVETRTAGNFATIEVDAPHTDAGQAAAEEVAEHQVGNRFRCHSETYRSGDLWMVVWEIH